MVGEKRLRRRAVLRNSTALRASPIGAPPRSYVPSQREFGRSSRRCGAHRKRREPLRSLRAKAQSTRAMRRNRRGRLLIAQNSLPKVPSDLPMTRESLPAGIRDSVRPLSLPLAEALAADPRANA